MRESERERIMERVMEREREIEEEKQKYRRRMREEDKIKNMPFVALIPLSLTISLFLNSSRVSIDPCSRTILIFADCGVKDGIELLKYLEEFRYRVESKKMKALEGEIREAAWELENVLDSHVSDLFLSQSEDESVQLGGDEKRPLLYCLSLEGIEHDIGGFVEMVVKMEKLLNPWLERGKDSDIFGLCDHSGVTMMRSWFRSWFAAKAASVFLGIKEDNVRDLENLLPEEEDGDDFSTSMSEDRFSKIKDDVVIWWINEAASLFMEEEKELLDNPLGLA